MYACIYVKTSVCCLNAREAPAEVLVDLGLDAEEARKGHQGRHELFGRVVERGG